VEDAGDALVGVAGPHDRDRALVGIHDPAVGDAEREVEIALGADVAAPGRGGVDLRDEDRTRSVNSAVIALLPEKLDDGLHSLANVESFAQTSAHHLG
jgi:hypothetical protein